MILIGFGITINFQNAHTELSDEAPPRAVQQVGEKAGYSGTGSSPPALLHCDKENNRLTFERLPINSLADLETDGIEQKYSGDPLEGGFLEIDPLVRFMSLDGREYFSGETENSQIRLLDRQEKVLFSATLATLVFEDDVSDQGFNLFAPILDILEADTSHSPWLQDYFTRLGAESSIIPELFVGFDIANTASSNPWESSFNRPVRAALSFGGVLTVPEISRAAASTALALLVGGLLLVGELSRHARQLEVRVSTSSLAYL